MGTSLDKMKLETYTEYKDSGVEWLGKIPGSWETKRIKFLFQIGRGRVIAQTELDEEGLYPVYSSQTQNNGVLGYIKTYDFDFTQITWTTDGANAGTVFLRTSKYNCTNVCGTLKPISNGQSIEFIKYALEIAAQFYKRPDTNGAKIMNGEMAAIFVTFPPLLEQTAIASFLDHKTALIDQAIDIKQKQLELLKERRQILIHKAVTRGLNPNAKMKDSGVVWIGEIPEGWTVVRSKTLFAERKERSRENDVQLTSSQKFGVIPQNEYMAIEGRRVTQVEFNREIQKHVEKGDFMISMRSFQGGIEYSEYEGCISSAYVSLIPCDLIVPSFYKYLLKSDRYIEALQSTSNLVRDGQALRYDNFKQVDLLKIPKEEQTLIANFIEKNNTKIATAISLKEQEIEKLKEYKATLINSAVTGKIKVC
jgi:type I restriction enzyme S subunit